MHTIGVVGAGTMGRGIAQVAGDAGYSVKWWDAVPGQVSVAKDKIREALEKRVSQQKSTPDQLRHTIANLHIAKSLEDFREADLVVEAIPEQLHLKQELFRTLENICSEQTILATNTSSLSIAEIARSLDRPQRVIGTHFFNPVPVMQLLEIVVHAETDDEVLESTRHFGTRLGKELITVRDFPGFASSRLGVCLGMEAIRMVEQGVASAEDIDRAMVLGYRHPVGPLRLTDLVGLDVRLHIGEYLATALGNPAFSPPPLMRQMVNDGKLGQKTGQGFYSWTA